jgi:hypothetical protein
MRRWSLGVVVSVAVLAAAPVRAAGSDARPVITALSSPPEFVTGGDVLVEVRVRSAEARARLRVEVGGVDVTDQFQPSGENALRGLVSGLAEGRTSIVATTKDGVRGATARLRVENHPIAGPVFSGAHQEPFYCETQAAGLGPALGEDCFAPTQVVYRYRTTRNTFAPLGDPTSRPDDLVMLQIAGVQVPYIVRLERGVINRGLYEIAALYDGAEPSPFRAEAGLNGRAVLTFGGGCNVGYHQGVQTGGVLNDPMLARGYVVASNSLLVNDTNCSPIVGAETALMTKERLVEVYGPVAHAIGSGGSGGAIMQYTISHGYPGILNGLLPSLSFADALSNAAPPDCLLLTRYLATPRGATLTLAQRRAIGGHQVFGACNAWVQTFSDRIDATRGCPSIVPRDTVYDPVTNPTGVRCSLADHLVKQLGRDPFTGFARSTFDNLGVQYGLAPLQAGVIGVDQFLDLNEFIGGFDGDGRPRARRAVADPNAVRAAYATGLIASGTGGLAETPAIDLRPYADRLGGDAVGDIHTSFWSVAIHERLVRDGIDERTHSRWIFTQGDNQRFAEALDAMEAWLTAIEGDRAPGTPAQKVARNRPQAAAPGCWPSPSGPKVLDLDACYAGPFPFTGDLRTVAGAPLTTDVTCKTRAPVASDYAVPFTDEQWARLVRIFPNGVCDYANLPGVGQVPLAGTYQRFE